MPKSLNTSLAATHEYGLQIRNAELDWSDEDSPRSIEFDDIYHSAIGALEESQHVFIKGTKLKERWQQGTENGSYTIGEIGFGSGLNFLMTWQQWQLSKHKPQQLHYVAFEKHPLKLADMRRLLLRHPTLNKLASPLLDRYVDHSKTCQRLRLAKDVLLDIHFGDALEGLKNLDHRETEGIHSWFLDGFSPKLNPLMWQEELFTELARLSNPGSTLATYSAAGFLRRQLADVGFAVTKTDGFGKKRHMTQATYAPAHDTELDAEKSIQSHPAPWYIRPKRHSSAGSAIVVGAGLAGCSAAYALAQRGIKVTVVEAGGDIAFGASGIPQLALRPRLFKTDSPLARFYLQSFSFSASLFKTLSLNQAQAPFWHNSEVIQLATAINKKSSIPIAVLKALYGEEIVEELTPAGLKTLTELEINQSALRFKKGGWVDSKQLCQSLLANENVKLVCNYSVSALNPVEAASEGRANTWEVVSEKGHPPIRGDVLILASSYQANLYEQTKTLPLQAVRGQVTLLPASPNEHRPLSAVLSGQRSLFPALNSTHTLAASYRQGSDRTALEIDDISNLEALQDEFPQLPEFTCAGSAVGIRCNTSDFTPVVGLAPNLGAMKQEYAALKRDAGAQFGKPGHYHDGLFLSLAHGSNGLATAPLAGETIASMVCGEVSPLSQSALAELSAARFIIRDLKKQK